MDDTLTKTLSARVALIGECMLELRHQSHSRQRVLQTNLSYGGDTLNTAVYLARLGVEVDYVTALGDDPMSAWMLQQWSQEGVGCTLVKLFAGRVPGLYMVQTDDQGERSFLYWRDRSPARELFDDNESSKSLLLSLSHYPWIYLSGITLALYSDKSLSRLFEFISHYRSTGGRIIFDGNYRPSLWTNTQSAKSTYETLYRMTDIALPTLSDETLLFEDTTPTSTVERLRSYGIAEIVLKMGDSGAYVANDSTEQIVKTIEVDVVDTTAAGDSFNAAYLAARLAGHNNIDAARAGHQLATHVIQHAGAIIDREQMPVNKSLH